MVVATVRDCRLSGLDARTLYAILRLRCDVFVVEQQCPYPELDGRDVEPDAQQLWIERDGEVVATLRLLREPDGAFRIGRVATARSARGAGLAAELMARALQLTGASPVVLDAQTPLASWYARFGFRPSGPQFLEDGIAHVPMRRESDR